MTNSLPSRDNDAFPPTRSSLLSRLKNASYTEGWEYFVDNYGGLIFKVCLRAGLTRQEAEDILQDTLAAVAKQMPNFEYDRDKGSFKGWLARVTRNHIADYLKKKKHEAVRRVQLPERRVDAIAAMDAATLDDVWEAEWRQHLLVRALSCLHRQLPARTVQIFQLSALDQWSSEKIAEALLITRSQVYLARHRAARLVKKEIERLRKELE